MGEGSAARGVSRPGLASRTPGASPEAIWLRLRRCIRTASAACFLAAAARACKTGRLPRRGLVVLPSAVPAPRDIARSTVENKEGVLTIMSSTTTPKTATGDVSVVAVNASQKDSPQQPSGMPVHKYVPAPT